MIFEIDKNSNRISKIQSRPLSALNLNERGHLQEWIANNSEALGEDLLIIQKEFSGFEETNERIDLLALDKEGTVVVIENKLDDSGKDVVWQALKYVSYCSRLDKASIIEIFQKYLDNQNLSENASDLICEYYNEGSITEVILNTGSNQRIILVGANFRKEVTSAALWLIENGIRIQCIKVNPFSFESKLLLNVSQIIPTEESKDYMIGMLNKKSEEKRANTAKKESHQQREKFWKKVLDHMLEKGFRLYGNVSPTMDHWLSAGSGKSFCVYTMIFIKSNPRIEFSMTSSSKDENKRTFDFLKSNSDQIEKDFGAKLTWDRLDEKKMSIIRYSSDFDGSDETNWDDMASWFYEHMKKFEKAIKPLIIKIPSH